jgi:hypothetical protein
MEKKKINIYDLNDPKKIIKNKKTTNKINYKKLQLYDTSKFLGK